MKEAKGPKKSLVYYYIIVLLILSLFNMLVSPSLVKHQIQEVDYGVSVEMIENKSIGQVEVDNSRIVFTDKDDTTVHKAEAMNDLALTERLCKFGAKFGANIEQARSPTLTTLLTLVLPMAIFIGLRQYMSRKLIQQMDGENSVNFGTGKSNTKVYVQFTKGIHSDDVAGEDEAKKNLAEIMDYLHSPKEYTDVDASMPEELLLVGLPGTGEIMPTRTVTGESNVPFFSISGSEFAEMFMDMGVSGVRDLFKQVKEKAPCIIFTNGINAIGKKRDGQMGGSDEREQTLNQLLTGMDGLEGNNGVITLAIINRPESLDSALTRPGRFDRWVPMEPPDLRGREVILKVRATKTKLADDVNFHTIARMASGASGAELANIINRAVLRAVRSNRQVVNQTDLEKGIETMIVGYQKKNTALSDQEKWVVPYHEIGYTLIAVMQSHSALVQKITIIPRTSGTLGYTMQVKEGDKYLMIRQETENKIITSTGGRAVEEVVFGEITTGASNDIEQITRLARMMIIRYGMSREFDMVAMEAMTSQYLGDDTSLACSADTQKEIDRKVVELVKRLYEKAKTILSENREKLDKLAQFLYKKETITGDEPMAILNQGGEKS